MDAAVPEVPVRDPPETEVGQERAECTQVRAEPRRRHRAVLPARPRLAPVERPGRRPRRVLPDPPQRPLPGRVPYDGGVQRVRCPDQPPGRVRPVDLGEQPRPAPGQPHRVRHEVEGHPSTVSGRYSSSPGAASAAAPSSAYPSTTRTGSAGSGTSRTVASVITPSVPSLPQKERTTSLPRSGSSASRAYPEIRRGSLRVAGPQQGEVLLHQLPQSGRRAPPLPPERQLRAPVGHHFQRAHVVRRGAPCDRVRPTGVVADHPAERAAAVRGRIGAEGQPVRAGRRPQPVEDEPRSDDRRPPLRVQGGDPAHVPCEVEHDARARGLPADGRPAAPGDHGRAVRPAHLQGRRDVGGVARATVPTGTRR